MRHLAFSVLAVFLAASATHSALADEVVPEIVAPPSRVTSTPGAAGPQCEGAPECGPSSYAARRTSDAPSPAQQPGSGSTWYGWQTLATDGAALLLLAIDFSQGHSDAGLLGGSGGIYGLGGPIVHLAHGKPGAAALSLTARTLTPLVGAIVGSAATSNCGTPNSEDGNSACNLQGIAYGFFAGAGLAMLIDAALLAREDVKPERPRSDGITVAPTAAVTKSTATVGAVGTF